MKFFLELLDQINIEFADLPNLKIGTSDTRLMLTQLSAFAEWEASKISERTKQALQAKKQRGELMGVMGEKNIKATNGKRKELANEFAKSIAPILNGLRNTMSQRQLVTYLNQQGIKSPTGKEWVLCSLQNVLKSELITLHELKLISCCHWCIATRYLKLKTALNYYDS